VDSVRTCTTGVYPTNVYLSIIALTPLKRHWDTPRLTVPISDDKKVGEDSLLCHEHSTTTVSLTVMKLRIVRNRTVGVLTLCPLSDISNVREAKCTV
jgi:hypothetical protein